MWQFCCFWWQILCVVAIYSFLVATLLFLVETLLFMWHFCWFWRLFCGFGGNFLLCGNFVEVEFIRCWVTWSLAVPSSPSPYSPSSRFCSTRLSLFVNHQYIYLDIITSVLTMELYVKVGRRYSDTADLLTTLIRPSKQWGPNHYQAKILTKSMIYLLQHFRAGLRRWQNWTLNSQV